MTLARVVLTIATHWLFTAVVMGALDRQLARRASRPKFTMPQGGASGDEDGSGTGEMDKPTTTSTSQLRRGVFDWLSLVPIVVLTPESHITAAMNIIVNGPLGILLAFMLPFPTTRSYTLLPTGTFAALFEVVVGLLCIDVLLWTYHYVAHASLGSAVPVVARRFLGKIMLFVHEKHTVHHTVGSVRNTRAVFVADSLEHFILVLSTALVTRWIASSAVSLVIITGLVTVGAMWSATFNIQFIKHRYDIAKGDRKGVPSCYVMQIFRALQS